MATFTDSKGRTWELRFTVPKFIKVCRKLSLKLNQIMSMNIEVADLLEAIPVVLEEQLRAFGMEGDAFLAELDGEDMTAAIQAFMQMVAEAFPKSKEEGGGSGPFDRGNSETSINSAPSQE